MIKIYKLFVNIIFITIIALLVVYLVFRVTDKVEIYRVKTGSMEEKIHVGDYIMIYRKDNYNVGEIVTYVSNDGFITHRIIRKEGNKVITKGDANNTEDREIIASTIVGEAILIGGILNFVINYKYVIVCVLISLYLFSCYFGDVRDQKEKEENIENKNTSLDEQDKKEKKENVQEEVKKEEIEKTEEVEEKKEEIEINEKKEEIIDDKEEEKKEESEEKPLLKRKDKKDK